MSQPPQSPRSASPLTARLYDLEYPRSLGVYSTYHEVQSVVDTLADKQFPVQSTLIVGTDLKLMERVTGRRTWPKVISQGALSGLWMGLFLGLLLLLLSPGNLTVIVTSVLLGIVFFTVSSSIGYAMSRGRRDYTSMTATIPMQYELLVEHKHAALAQRILSESGAAPAPQRPAPPVAAAQTGSAQYGVGQPDSGHYGAGQHVTGQFADSAARPEAPGASAPSPSRPAYGRPAPSASEQSAGPGRSGRPSFGAPAGVPLREDAGRAQTPPAATPATPPPEHPAAEQPTSTDRRPLQGQHSDENSGGRDDTDSRDDTAR